MQRSVDILDERDPLTGPFIGSVLLHGCVLGAFFVGWFWVRGKTEQFGDPHPAGGQAYSVSPVHTIPIPQKDAPPNPVAHDTESLAPAAPEEKPVEKKPPPMVPPPLDAFQIPDKIKPQKEQPHPQQRYTTPAPPNQIYSRTPQAVSNPIYGAPPGSGQVGIGPNSVLGTRFGAYAVLIRDRLSQNWQTNGLNAHTQTAAAVVDFHVLNGHITDVKVVQSSGNAEIDNTAMRAVYASDPLTPFPPQLSGNSILAEFTFNLH